MSALAPFLGLAVLHLAGAGLLAVAGRVPFRATLRRPVAALLSLAVLYLLSLGALGVGVLAVAALTAWAVRPREAGGPAAFPTPLLVALGALTLARPWVPTQWDEFVWLGKARLESLGFGAGVRAALDPAQHLVPTGYPTLWPSAVGWLSLGRDVLAAHTVAGSLLVLLALAAALEAWAPLLAQRGRVSRLALVAVLATPLAWVHLRSTYVDLPVGLLGLALAGHLVGAGGGRPPVEALATAIVLVGFKDEGLAHVLAATAAAWLVAERKRAAWRLLAPALVALLTVAAWRFLMRGAGVDNADHALAAPYWPWAPKLASLLWLHATDVLSWGVFWAVALAVLLRKADGAGPRALRWLVLVNLAFIAVALLCGPERVRVFAENGTLLNRLLMQLWPGAAVAVLASLRPEPD